MRAAVLEFCANLAHDPLLVQGAGGNVSWKDGGTLWIKASGTSLGEALTKSIFVPVDLTHLQDAVAQGAFGVIPRVRADSSLRPSIETVLHGLMPFPLVVHLHPVEALTYLVREDAEDMLGAHLATDLRWARVAYAKPGAALARALADVLASQPDAEVIFMQNHGIVIGGSDVHRVSALLISVLEKLKTKPRLPTVAAPVFLAGPAPHGYRRLEDSAIDQLARDPELFNCLLHCWALYPEQVVFLGAQALTCECLEDLPPPRYGIAGAQPVFVRGLGVFVPPGFGPVHRALLRHYYEVLARQPDFSAIRPLTVDEVAELLNWDAEKYRAQMVH